MRRAAVTGAGVFKDETSDARLRQVFFDGAIESYEIVVPDFGRIAGPFQITALEYRGDHAGEVTFEMAFESAGALTFTAFDPLPLAGEDELARQRRPGEGESAPALTRSLRDSTSPAPRER